SSRRRHTSFKCDWSSDVCSSGLRAVGGDLVDYRQVAGAERVESAPRDVLVLLVGHSSSPLLGVPPTLTGRGGRIKRGSSVRARRSEERRVGKEGGLGGGTCVRAR